MKTENDIDYSELQSLLRADAEKVPHRDLEDGFLNDLHARIISGSSNVKKASWFDRFSLSQCSPWAWGGAVTVTILLGVMLGLGEYGTNAGRSVCDLELSPNNLVYVKADDRVDFSGSIPAFETKPQEF